MIRKEIVTMGKKLFVAFIFALLCSTMSFGTALAIQPMYVAHSSGGAADTDFGLAETPWLFVSLPNTGLSFTSYWWTDGSATDFFTFTVPTTDQQSWYSFDSFTFNKYSGGVLQAGSWDWDSIKHTGPWNIKATYSYPLPPTSGGEYNYAFNVVPEPISATLFLLGGAAFVTRTYRRKKAKV